MPLPLRGVWFLSTLLGMLLLTTTSHALDSTVPADLIARLDDHYYYPQRQGIKSFSVRIHWAELDPTSTTENKSYLNNPPVRFTWSREEPEGRFELDSTNKDVSAIRELEILKFLKNFQEAFLPLPLEEKLRDFNLTGSMQRNSQLAVRYTTREVNPIRQFDFLIDPDKWRIQSLRMKREHAPYDVDSRLAFALRENKWQVVESQTRFSVSDRDYEENTRWTFGQEKGFWMPTKVKQELHQGKALVHSIVFNLSDYRVN